LDSGSEKQLEFYIWQTLASFIPGTRLNATAGEPFAKEYGPHPYNEARDKAFYEELSRLLPGMPGKEENVIKNRDVFGHVIPAPDRWGFILQEQATLDFTLEQMVQLGMDKRPPHPEKITHFQGIDLRKFKFTPQEKKVTEQALGILPEKGVNAYEDYLIMAGSGTGKGMPTSTYFEVTKYFKSEEYKTLKASLDVDIDDMSDFDKERAIEEAELAYSEINKMVNKIILAGKENAANFLYVFGHLYKNEGGVALSEIYAASQQRKTEVEMSLTEKLKGGNK